MDMLFGFIGGLGGGEILLVLAIVVIFFGAKKIPELAKGLGSGLREFKNASREIQADMQKGKEETTPETTR